MGGKNAKQSQKTGLDPSYCNPCSFPFGILSPFDVIRTLAGVGALGPFGSLLGGLGGGLGGFGGGCSPFGGFGGGCSPFNNLGCSPFSNLGCSPFNNLGCGPFNNLGCSPFNGIGSPFSGLGLGGLGSPLAPLAMPFGFGAGLPNNAFGAGCSPFGAGLPFGAGFNGLNPFGGGLPGAIPQLGGCAGGACNGIVPFRGSIAPLAMPWANGPGLGLFPGAF